MSDTFAAAAAILLIGFFHPRLFGLRYGRAP
jgi:hypothetical protein